MKTIAVAQGKAKTVDNPEENQVEPAKRKKGGPTLGLKGAKSSFIWFSSQMATVIRQ